MPMQLGMMVHLRPSLSAAMDAGNTTMRLTTDIAENVAPATHSVHYPGPSACSQLMGIPVLQYNFPRHMPAVEYIVGNCKQEPPMQQECAAMHTWSRLNSTIHNLCLPGPGACTIVYWLASKVWMQCRDTCKQTYPVAWQTGRILA